MQANLDENYLTQAGHFSYEYQEWKVFHSEETCHIGDIFHLMWTTPKEYDVFLHLLPHHSYIIIT